MRVLQELLYQWIDVARVKISSSFAIFSYGICLLSFIRLQKRNLVQLQYLQLGHYNLVFNSPKVTRSIREVGRKENEATYLVYCNTFINLHHHCLGVDLMCRYIGRQVDGKVGKWVGRQIDGWVGEQVSRQMGEGGGQGAQASSLNVGRQVRPGQAWGVRKKPSDTVKSLGFFKSYLFILNQECASLGQDGSSGRMGPPKGPSLLLRSLV